MKTTNYLIPLLIISLLSIFTLSQCDRRSTRRSKQTSKSVRNITVPKNERKKQEWVFKNYNSFVFGIDISHHQGLIDWNALKQFSNQKEIGFVLIRSSRGSYDNDIYFNYNWASAQTHNFIRGAYHYYRPNENSTKQAQNYINRVKLKKGDLPPILDIEKRSTIQSVKALRKGIKNWLNIVEQHYGVKPILYSGDKFYKSYLKGHGFDKYILWIANYNRVEEPKTKFWSFWQFSDKGKTKGINEHVDFDVFNGSEQELNQLRIK